MKDEMLALFREDARVEAAARFGIEASTLRPLDAFENIVMEGERSGLPYILRITHSSHRTAGMILAELDWVHYLAAHGVSVCRPVASVNGLLAEPLQAADEQFTAVVFEKAPGGPVRRDNWTSGMTYNRGKQLGRMHALSKAYEPAAGIERRHIWYENADFANYRQYLREEDRVVADRMEELQEALRAMPTDGESFGLIHMDAHTGNMFFNGDQPTLFDFDDCSYDFFVSDIAIALFYAVLMFPADRDLEAFAREFLHTLLAGYRSKNQLANHWQKLLPMILKRRELVLYVAIIDRFDTPEDDSWCRAYLDGRRERIEHRMPVLDLDWSAFDLGG